MSVSDTRLAQIASRFAALEARLRFIDEAIAGARGLRGALRSAEVTVAGTQLVTITNDAGEYRLSGVPAGSATSSPAARSCVAIVRAWMAVPEATTSFTRPERASATAASMRARKVPVRSPEAPTNSSVPRRTTTEPVGVSEESAANRPQPADQTQRLDPSKKSPSRAKTAPVPRLSHRDMKMTITPKKPLARGVIHWLLLKFKHL